MKIITQAVADRWATHLATGGLRRWWVIKTLSRHCDQPSAAHLLAQCEQKIDSLSMTKRVEKALRRITSQSSADAVIDCWLKDEAGETVQRIIEEQGWRHSNEARWIMFLTKRNRFDGYFVEELAPLVNQPTVARLLAYPEGVNASKFAAEAAAAALSHISKPEAADAVIDCWLEDKAGETVQRIIEEQGWRHSDEAKRFAFLGKRNRFDEYFVVQVSALVDNPDLVASILIHSGQESNSHAVYALAAYALCQVPSWEAVDAVIDGWLEGKASGTMREHIERQGWRHQAEQGCFNYLTERQDRPDKLVRHVIEGQGWRHSSEPRWLLYLTATGRFDEYLAEDFEFQTLRPEFLAAPAALKARIREAVVKQGEVRMNGLFLVEKQAAELTPADAEALAQTHIRNHNWDTLVRNLWWLPARQILDAIQAIAAADWKPDDVDQASLLTLLGELVQLLATGGPEGPGTLPLNPVYQKWLIGGETGPLSQKPPAELKRTLKDATDPPAQIAALGALRKQGQLDKATVDKAGLSGHWMVRWVAVHLGADLTKAMRVNDAGIEWFRRLSMFCDSEIWAAKPCQLTRDGLEALREHIARLPDPRFAGGLLLVEAICTHYTGHDFEVEEGGHVMVDEDSFELEG